MAQWAAIQQYPQATRQIQSIYGNQFPIEVRHFLSEWIEQQRWSAIELDNLQHVSIAESLLNSLLQNLEKKIGEFEGDQFFPVILKLQEAGQMFKNSFGQNPMAFIRCMRQCLEMERNLIEQAKAPVLATNGEEPVPNACLQIEAVLQDLDQKTKVTEQKLKTLQTEQESFVIACQTSHQKTTQIQQLTQMQAQGDKQTKVNAMLQQLKTDKEQLDKQLTQKVQELLKNRLSLSTQYKETLLALQEVQTQVLDTELIQWKRRQQQVGHGAQVDEELNTLQKWCEQLAELIWQNRQQIKKVNLLCAQLPLDSTSGNKNLFLELTNGITGLLSSLVTSTFVVESQPPQVLKKDSRFGSTIRLLVGSKLNVNWNPPQVKATIISEKQAKELLKGGNMKVKEETSGNILNNVGTMEFQSASGQLSIHFRNMQLKSIKRADKKGTEAVTEEKFCILFQSDFNVGGQELVFQVWTYSLPVVVTVHGNQECNALATILWDNAFSLPGRTPFEVPESVPWPKLAEQLNYKFKAATGRDMTDHNLQYLATKLLGPSDNYVNHSITWTQFNKEALPNRNFTFWEWFYAVLKLAKEHLKGPWNDGSIIGFISKVQAQEWLLTKTNGTFLLRFSDSEVGGITIAWVADNNGKTEVWNLAPFTAKDFIIRGLADRIKDLSNLQYLYPEIPKDNAFSKYYVSTPEQPLSSLEGYIKPSLINILPGVYGAPMGYDNPQTPMINPGATPVYDHDPPSVSDVGYMDSSSVTSPQQNIDLSGALEMLDDQWARMDYGADDNMGNIVSDLLNSAQTMEALHQGY